MRFSPFVSGSYSGLTVGWVKQVIRPKSERLLVCFWICLALLGFPFVFLDECIRHEFNWLNTKYNWSTEQTRLGMICWSAPDVSLIYYWIDLNLLGLSRPVGRGENRSDSGTTISVSVFFFFSPDIDTNHILDGYRLDIKLDTDLISIFLYYYLLKKYRYY